MASTSVIENQQQESSVEILETPNIRVIPFAVSVPPTNLDSFTDQPQPKTNPILMMGEKSIVGSIVLLNKSVMVWVGWGSTALAGSASLPYGRPQTNFGTGESNSCFSAFSHNIYHGADRTWFTLIVVCCRGTYYGAGSCIHATNELQRGVWQGIQRAILFSNHWKFQWR